MDFFKFIQSLDELLYEVMSWLIFYPLTLWRVLTSPLKTMGRVEQELGEEDALQFDDMLPPPLFLLLTLVLLHAIELGLVGQSELVRSNVGLKRLIASDTTLIVFRILMIATLPLVTARRLLRTRGDHLNKVSLKAPFYAQCYIAAAFALIWFLGTYVGSRSFNYSGEAYLTMTMIALCWLIAVESYWFARSNDAGLLRGFGQALLSLMQWVAVLVVVGLILA